MNTEKTLISHSHLPYETQRILFLIKEDLKIRKFFDGLRKLGLEDCCYHPDLSALILYEAGFDEHTDELLNYYQDILGQYSNDLNASDKILLPQAIEVYGELVRWKSK